MIIRKLTKLDAKEFWDLRFKALQEDGDAFGATYEEEINKPMEDLIGKFNNNYISPVEENFILGAFNDENKIIGVVGFHRENRAKIKHKATIWGMYVDSNYRRLKVGKNLINNIINIVKGMEGLEQLNLVVVSNNVKAVSLYKTVGFITYGKEKNAIKCGNKYFDEDYMVYFVK